MSRRFGDSSRPYATTHPWITFRFDMSRLSAIDFLYMGEVISKSDHVCGVPLSPEVAQELHIIYLAKGVHATTQIEGNTLSEEEVLALVKGDLDLPESQEYLKQENQNIVDACSMIANELADGQELHLNRARIEQLNALVLKGLPLKPGHTPPGHVRTHGVTVGNVYVGPHAGDCGYLLDQLCKWLDALTEPDSEWKRPVALIRAILAHLYLAWIHPFSDGNGRTARLVEFQLLLEAGFPTPVCHLASNYYNRTRQLYYEVLRETSKISPYKVENFVTYALRGLTEELREQLDKIKGHQLGTVWVNFVHEADLGQSAPTAKRRRDLVLALPNGPGELTPISSIRKLTPDLALHYAGKTTKTITRDLNALVNAGLLVREGSAVRPRIETMLAFLPLRNSTA